MPPPRRNVALWPKQRELLAAIETGPRIHVWALGRRSGKTTMAALVCLWDALLRPQLAESLRPGAAVCVRYRVRIVTDQYAAPAVVERLRAGRACR